MVPNPSPNYLYLDNEIRVEKSTQSVVAHPYISVVKNYTIFEKEIAALEADFEIDQKYLGIEDIKSISKTVRKDNDKLILIFDFGIETVEKEIND